MNNKTCKNILNVVSDIPWVSSFHNGRLFNTEFPKRDLTTSRGKKLPPRNLKREEIGAESGTEDGEVDMGHSIPVF